MDCLASAHGYNLPRYSLDKPEIVAKTYVRVYMSRFVNSFYRGVTQTIISRIRHLFLIVIAEIIWPLNKCCKVSSIFKYSAKIQGVTLNISIKQNAL